MKKYQLIYADPPWQYKDKASACERGAAHKYQVMNIDDICNLPVKNIADDNCLLAMWWVPPMPAEALKVVESWGFNFKNMFGFVWHKKTVNGKDHFGMGNYTRANAEACLIATKGRPIRNDASVRSIVETVVEQHSKKPDEIRDRLVKLVGDVPRIELFSRHIVNGWDSWGNEIECKSPFESE